jgi:uncharacterized membrane protein YqjE
MLKIGERFLPHLNLEKVYFAYLALVFIPLLLISSMPILIAYTFFPYAWETIWPYLFIPLIVVLFVLGFVAYWTKDIVTQSLTC